MTNLPVTMIEAEAVTVTRHFFDLFAELMPNEAARYLLRKKIAAWVRQGDLECQLRVIEAARAGHADAALALREVVLEMFERREMPPTMLLAWHEEQQLRPLNLTYPPGRNLADSWLRKIVIAICVDDVCARFHLKPARTRVLSRKNVAGARRRPSASYVVAEAYTASPQCPGTIGERQVERIHADYFKIARRIMSPN